MVISGELGEQSRDGLPGQPVPYDASVTGRGYEACAVQLLEMKGRVSWLNAYEMGNFSCRQSGRTALGKHGNNAKAMDVGDRRQRSNEGIIAHRRNVPRKVSRYKVMGRWSQVNARSTRRLP
jgi:hypothetical protein